MTDRFIIGKITGAHGVRGEVKVFPITDNVRHFKKLKKVGLADNEGNIKKEMDISAVRFDRGNVLISFDGIDDRDKAELLKGSFISIDRKDASPISKDEFYIADMIGLTVIDDERGELGIVNEVYETGANFIVSVKRKGKKDLQIPFLKDVCYEVDIEGRKMLVRLPEGLYEIYETKKK
ncbi:MAG: 16S rRNA processing protein RimM [Clostridiales bacterium]|nr:16S rRNA processing protein RimM [Clostridiales bacterium]